MDTDTPTHKTQAAYLRPTGADMQPSRVSVGVSVLTNTVTIKTLKPNILKAFTLAQIHQQTKP